jgi:hypothetical protein
VRLTHPGNRKGIRAEAFLKSSRRTDPKIVRKMAHFVSFRLSDNARFPDCGQQLVSEIKSDVAVYG